ncbi:MAG: TIGR02679 family protein [Desulforudis sp.]|nr:MAG: TIGR02679 family protein [Desulforudis sp.]
MMKKYQGLGRVGGSVTLKNPTNQEREALSLFLGRDYTGRMSATVSLETFTDALGKTKYSGIGFKELLDGYVGHDVLTRVEEQEGHRSRKVSFFRDLAGKHDSTYGRLWLEHIERSGPGTRGIHLAFEKHPDVLSGQLENVLAALSRLTRMGEPGKHAAYERLPVFASQTVHDPHGFDLDTDQGRYLIAALQLVRSQQDQGYSISSRLSAEEVTELFGYFGIIRDDLLNFVTCAGLLALREGNEPVALWRASWDDGAVLNVPLREIARIRAVVPAASFDHPDQPRVVFVVENSGVFSEIMDGFSGTYLPPVVCTHGQFKLACLMLLDKLVANNTIIYYSGDFDPEGLQMAVRLLQRYPNQAVPWRYTVDDYGHCMSEVTLSESRLKRVNTIDHPLLVPVRDIMRSVRKAGYQEYLVKDLVDDIKDVLG